MATIIITTDDASQSFVCYAYKNDASHMAYLIGCYDPFQHV